jgi:hypothetical protein
VCSLAPLIHSPEQEEEEALRAETVGQARRGASRSSTASESFASQSDAFNWIQTDEAQEASKDEAHEASKAQRLQARCSV